MVEITTQNAPEEEIGAEIAMLIQDEKGPKTETVFEERESSHARSVSNEGLQSPIICKEIASIQTKTDLDIKILQSEIIKEKIGCNQIVKLNEKDGC